MNDWEDRESLFCMYCKHKWILQSNKQITLEQHKEWIIMFVVQHSEICGHIKEE